MSMLFPANSKVTLATLSSKVGELETMGVYYRMAVEAIQSQNLTLLSLTTLVKEVSNFLTQEETMPYCEWEEKRNTLMRRICAALEVKK